MESLFLAEKNVLKENHLFCCGMASANHVLVQANQAFHPFVVGRLVLHILAWEENGTDSSA